MKDSIWESMTSKTQLNLSHIKNILKLYGMDQIKEFHPISQGITNSTYQVTTNRKNVFLKVNQDKDIFQLRGEMEIYEYLNQLNFPYCARPIKTTEKQTIFQYQGMFGIMLPFTQGHAPEINEKNCHELGRSLGKLHKITEGKDFPRSVRAYRAVGHDISTITDYLQTPRCPEDFKTAYHQTFPHGLCENTNMTVGLIHGDYFYDNALFQQDRIKLMIDLEQAGVGPLLLDLGIAISGSCHSQFKIDPKLVKAYVEGYEVERQLNDEERDQLDDMICVGCFSIALWRIERFLEGNLNPKRKNSYKELIERALNYRKLIS